MMLTGLTISTEGHQWFYTMLREHLMEQARNGAHKFAFRAYRHIALMDTTQRLCKCV
jgi:hypothetical protein